MDKQEHGVVAEALGEFMSMTEKQKCLALGFMKGIKAEAEVRASEPLPMTFVSPNRSDADAE